MSVENDVQNQLFEAVLKSSFQYHIWLDSLGFIRGVNEPFAQLFGLNRRKITGARPRELNLPAHYRNLLESLDIQTPGQRGMRQGCEEIAGDPPQYLVWETQEIGSSTEKQSLCLISFSLSSSSVFEDFFTNAQEAFFLCDREGNFLVINPAMERLMGFEDQSQFLLQHPTLQSTMNVPQRISDWFFKILTEKSSINAYECELQDAKAKHPLVSINARIIRNRMDQVRIEGSMVDIQSIKRIDDKLYRMAYFHQLTTLPNRSKLLQDLNNLIRQSEYSDLQLTLIVMDIDRFKVVNDSLGPVFGDELIQTFARRLREHTLPGVNVYSLGSDEFAVLIKEVYEPEDLERYVEQLMEVLSQPVLLMGRNTINTVSMGSVTNLVPFRSADNLLRAADTAMTRARALGGARHIPFQVSMYQKAIDRLEMEDDLRKAIEQKDFVLYYQPIVTQEPRDVIGCEALIRWPHPDKGFISPADFIPVSEETGLIVSLGEWIVREAVRQVSEWHQEGKSHIFVSVNISVYQFQAGNLAEFIQSVLEEFHFPANRIKLEITESIAMKNVDYTVSTFDKLSRMGVQLSIDDFGTGYSSLAYLKAFPFHNLKIDQSFVQDLTSKPEDQVLVQTITEMARNLNLQVTAEGVETEEQLKILQEMGLNVYQGYYFGRPIPANEFLPWTQAFIENGEF